MDIPRINTPFPNMKSCDIIGEHYELTGKTRIGYRFFGFVRVIEFEVQRIVTVDHSVRYEPVDVREYVQRTEWIRA